MRMLSLVNLKQAKLLTTAVAIAIQPGMTGSNLHLWVFPFGPDLWVEPDSREVDPRKITFKI